MFSDLNMNGDEITWNATQPLYQGTKNAIPAISGPCKFTFLSEVAAVMYQMLSST